MIVCFQLSMPSNNSWNGRWSGDEQLHIILKTFRDAAYISKMQEIVKKGSFSYSFGDGWVARIDVRQIGTQAEAARLVKQNAGFCGYDWMVDSIVDYGKILRDDQVSDFLAKQKAAATS